MAYFNSPCKKNPPYPIDIAPVPTPPISTYTTDYIRPMDRIRQRNAKALANQPSAAAVQQYDMGDEDEQQQLWQQYQWQEQLHQQPQQQHAIAESREVGWRRDFKTSMHPWKRENRAAAAAWWIRPLDERRKFVETLRGKGTEEDGGVNGAVGDQHRNDGQPRKDDAQMQMNGGGAMMGDDNRVETMIGTNNDHNMPTNMTAGDGEIVGIAEGMLSMNLMPPGMVGNVPCHTGAC